MTKATSNSKKSDPGLDASAEGTAPEQPGQTEPVAAQAAAQSDPAAPSGKKLADEVETFCTDLERFFRHAFGDMPKAIEIGELRAQQSAVRDFVQRASGSAAEAGKEVTALTGERDRLKEAALRARADFLNYQSRTAKDLSRAEELALRGYAKDMLAVLDSLDLAEKDASSADADVNRVRAALHMIATGLRQALTVHGLKRLEVLDKPFDPSVHEAVAKRPADASQNEKPDTVVDELRAGYLWHGLLLRPAQVLVAGKSS